jgi:hypothetical protein
MRAQASGLAPIGAWRAPVLSTPVLLDSPASATTQRAAKVPFGWADKQAEKYCWLIYFERKILFYLKKQAEKDEL